MLKQTIMDALNHQVRHEAESSHTYLAMAVWAETSGLDGTAQFLYAHAEEERQHMLKLMRFINERGGEAEVPALDQPVTQYEGLKAVFESILHHETRVTNAINEVVDLCLKEKDYTTHNFMQWYVAEQIEEEALARQILDKLTLAGDDKGALYMFDRDIIGFGDHGEAEEA
ncbi:MAG: ferritin [Flavobacteriales bacterium]